MELVPISGRMRGSYATTQRSSAAAGWTHRTRRGVRRLRDRRGNERGATTGGPTPTATPIPCATRATTTATVWNESDKQIHGSIGGARRRCSAIFTIRSACQTNPLKPATETLGRMTVSPDGHHIGVIVDVFVPNSRGYYPYVVDTTTHAVTRVGTLGGYDPSSNEPRQLTWADNQTLLIFPGIRGVPSTDPAYSYNITTAAVTPLPGLTGVVEGVARCGVLFYMDFTERTSYSDARPHAGVQRAHPPLQPGKPHRDWLSAHYQRRLHLGRRGRRYLLPWLGRDTRWQPSRLAACGGGDVGK